LEVMQESHVTIEGQSVPLSPPFMTIATQNPVEHEGTYPLPEAQLDRFLFKVLIDYPTEDAETQIVKSVTLGKVGDALDVNDINTVLSTKDLIAAQHLVARTHVDDSVIDYAVRLVRETREMTGIRMGAGPRGSISIIRAARASAFLEKRQFVTPDDVKTVARPTLRHRIALAPELEIEAYRPDDILEQVLTNVSAPRQ
ncbi:MAG: AAA family ATPase, partial [Woeseiaceae bacterium]